MNFDKQMELANFLFTFGSFIFTGIGLVLALLTVFAGYLTIKAERIHRSWERDLRNIREQQEKINNTLIVTSDLAISALPQMTFTQQVPIAVMDDVGIIDDIFDGSAGSRLWDSVAAQPRAARLAFARAVYRLGTHADSRKALVGVRRTGDISVSALELLDSAFSAAERSLRNPVSLQRDILSRKCQVLRQSGEMRAARSVALELLNLHQRRGDKTAYFIGSLSLALVDLQIAHKERSLVRRAEGFAQAAERLAPPFALAFDEPQLEGVDSKTTATLDYYRSRQLGVELSSIAYYTAKALWSYKFTCININDAQRPRGVFGGAGGEGAKLRRSIDVAALFFESLRREQHSDSCISAIYNFCVANIICAANEIPEAFLGFEEFKASFPEFIDKKKLTAHASFCLDQAADRLSEIRHSASASSARFIYSERSEKLDSMSAFAADIRWLRSVIDGKSLYCDLFNDKFEEYE